MFRPRGHLEQNCPETTMMTAAVVVHSVSHYFWPHAALPPDNKRNVKISNVSSPHFHLDVNATTETQNVILWFTLMLYVDGNPKSHRFTALLLLQFLQAPKRQFASNLYP